MNKLILQLKKVFNSLVFRVAGIAFLTFFIAILIFFYMQYNHINRIEKRMITEMGSFTNTFSLACREAILTLNYPLIENYVQQISSIKEDLLAVAIFDREGKTINQYARNQEELNSLKKISDEIAKNSASSNFNPFNRYLSQKSYLVVKPITVEKKGYGWVALVFSLREVQQERLNLTFGALIVGLFLFIAFIVSFFYLRANLVKPILNLSEASRQLAEGNFFTQVPTRSVGELGEVEKSFNEMASKLKDLTDKMAEAQENLKSQLNQVNLLCSLSQSLSSILEISEVFELGLEATKKIVENVEAGGYFIFDRENRNFELAFYQSPKNGELPVLGKFRPNPYLEADEIEFFQRDEAQANEWPPFLFSSSKSSIWLPLKSRRELIAYLVLETNKTDGFIENEIDTSLLSAFADHLAIGVQNAILYEEIRQQYFRTIAALAEAIEAKDPSTHGHCNRVAHYATLIARRLGFNDTQIAHLQAACYLHDVGKIAIPESILCKPDVLTPEEREVIKTHPQKGCQVVEAAGLDPSVIKAILEHHEWFDGSGYPEGKKGTEISLEARILAIADSFEAMISERPYRPAKSIHQAQKELKACAGTQFDPMLVTIFLEIIGNKERFIGLVEKR